MTRSLILAVAVSGMMLTPAAAESSRSLKAAFENTIVSTYPSGRSTRLCRERTMVNERGFSR